MQIVVAIFLAAIVGCYGNDSTVPPAPSFTSDPQGTRTTKYTISWKVETTAPVDEYGLMYGRRGDEDEWKFKFVPARINEGEIHTQMYRLENLQPGTEYAAVVKARNKFGWSDPSEALLFKTKSEDVPDNSERNNCVEENSDYISECLTEGAMRVVEKLADPPKNKNLEDLSTCGLYIETVFCTVERINEKCGEEALKAFVRDISNTPEAVKNACRAVGVEIDFSLPEDKRKK